MRLSFLALAVNSSAAILNRMVMLYTLPLSLFAGMAGTEQRTDAPQQTTQQKDHPASVSLAKNGFGDRFLFVVRGQHRGTPI
jgi:hypothetical protein